MLTLMLTLNTTPGALGSMRRMSDRMLMEVRGSLGGAGVMERRVQGGLSRRDKETDDSICPTGTTETCFTPLKGKFMLFALKITNKCSLRSKVKTRKWKNSVFLPLL